LRTSTLQKFPALKPEDSRTPGETVQAATKPLDVALLTGGTDRHYAYGLAMSLVNGGARLDVVGGDAVDGPEMHATPGLNFLGLRKAPGPKAGALKKVRKLLAYYVRLIAYAWNARPEIFHILWNNRIEWFDRTLLMLYYRVLGKKIVVTAHNVNKARRDGKDSLANRLTLRIQYHLANHIFVHTEKMKEELMQDFGVREKAVTVIPYGINNALPPTKLTVEEAKQRLGVTRFEKTILFFGNIRASKGLDILLGAVERLIADGENVRVVVAGKVIKGQEDYWSRVRPVLERLKEHGRLILRDEFIPDEDVAMYFKGADVLALPYTDIFQSGVMFLGYSFGLPVIATDVGSMREDIIEDRTGFLCKPCDAVDLADTIEKYFASQLFRELDRRRKEIRDYVISLHSWSNVAAMTHAVYQRLTEQIPFYSRLLHSDHSVSDSGRGC
jgi:D-inositol-3-phosphate glycosyltransferase